jgi:hypothetical protein
MSDASRHLRAVPNPAPRASAEREIAVRFTATSGLVARLHKPLNSFHWVGPATLRFSSQGVLITAKRATWLGLRQMQRFIAAEEISDVYREANAVQVHLHGSRNVYFRLWAEDSAGAAQIVELLPTKHTIEFESAIREPEIVIAWRVPVVGLVVLLAVFFLGTLAWVAEHRELAVRAPEARQLPPPRSALPSVKPEAIVTSEDGLLAEQDLSVFGARIEALSNEFKMAYEALQDGTVTQEKFADELDQWLRPQWDALEARLRRTAAAQGSARERADHELMGVINNWQLALYAYADDLRNQRQVVKSFEYLGRAHGYLQRAQQMQSDLQRSRASEASSPTNSH